MVRHAGGDENGSAAGESGGGVENGGGSGGGSSEGGSGELSQPLEDTAVATLESLLISTLQVVPRDRLFEFTSFPGKGFSSAACVRACVCAAPML